MPTVDSKGRIVIPHEVRERLDIDPGDEVTVREADGRLVVEPDPDPDPDAIVDRLEQLVAETAADAESDRTRPIDDVDPAARRHRAAVRRGASGDEH